MSTNREGYFVSDTERECTKCGTIFPKSTGMTICKACNTKRVKEQLPSTRMWRRAKERARIKDIDFSIKKEDIDIPAYCPILGIELKVNSGKSGVTNNSPSLDRLDNSKGYTPDNIWVISGLANRMKSNASPEELIMFANWVMEIYGED